MKQKLVLIGNGMAGINCMEEILKVNPSLYEMTVFGSEPHYNYNRIMLSTVLQGDTKVDDITLHDRAWYERNDIRLYAGETVIQVDTVEKTVSADRNRKVSYDKLIIATGSVPFMLPIPGADKEGVVSFRTIEDCQKMIEIAGNYQKAAVIGGGLLGLEAARGLLNLGMEVNVVHIANHLMERQLDPTAALMLEQELKSQGMKFLLEKTTEEIIGARRVEGLRFTDGTALEADMVVMAVGVRPNVQLAKESGIETNRAILVNDYLQTSVPDVYAVGECVEHRGMVYGLVKPLYEQGRVLAAHLCAKETAGYEGSTLATQLKISGVNVFSAGNFQADAPAKTMMSVDELAQTYKKIVLRDEKVIGAVMFGDTKASNKLLDMIAKQKVITDEEKQLLLQSTGAEPEVVTMEQTELICQCNAVSKGAIIEACQSHELASVEEIKNCTKASSACGGCKLLVSELLSYIQSEDFDEVVEKEAMCACTTLTDEEIVQEMQIRRLSSVHDVIEQLGWKTKDGCRTCVPALHYYLGMIYPEYEAEQEALFLNERMNAVVQSDGTYAITPQMYGGITNADELRRIADIAEKHRIPNVAVTSEQRIHLYGIPKEQLEAIWRELDLPLRSAAGNRGHTIKTCLGETACTCEKERALELAVEIEKKMDSVPAPHRLKVGVSACSHNGAGSTTKDVGIIQFARGWELYVGGSSGRHVRQGQLLSVVETAEEACELVIAFVQYYRETAKYGERTWDWINRVNLLHIREVLFAPELRQQLSGNLEQDALQIKARLAKTF
ncbi:nitrite reductase large subunit NirB [Alkalihalobacillus oceani]|uniref:Nitrite reductase large subunit NirB n=1 Tax=Halalkalibacter oceani TaxID=1653776 RepID=A0A9X2DPT3_9BACI|nr:nitrite reductase large subunit NirB [Halalkalibacter oceani]MCM3714689.1 nitrite reductase large subunit NirB [Halalkalibacter oceani]